MTALTASRVAPSKDRPVVALLARTWDTRQEAGWALRQVAGAMACSADVHVLTPQGTNPCVREDGAFTLHELASWPDPSLEARRDILVEAMLRARDTDASTVEAVPVDVLALPQNGNAGQRVVSDLVTGELSRCWEPGTDVLNEIAPDLVVVADYRQAGALSIIDRVCGDVPLVVVPLGTDLDAMTFPAFAPLFERAMSALVFTESELRALSTTYDELMVHNVGLPMSANNSVLREPNPYLGHSDYVIVVSGVREDSTDLSAALARLVRASFAGRSIAVVSTDAFSVSVNGMTRRPLTVERGSDLLRLSAWARATVDLRPGRLFARRSVESLLYSTPIVVPSHSRAREHAEAGGGLWFEGPSDLACCVEAMFEPAVREPLGARGMHYAQSRYGSTDAFIDRVVSATSLYAESLRRPMAE